MIVRIPLFAIVILLLLAGAGIGSRGVVRDITLPPVSTFRDRCARCHGYEGSAYGKEFAGLGVDSLRSVTEDMMFGPAGLSPDSVDVDAMTAYNASLKNSVPFAVILNAGSFLDGRDSTLQLEISPGGSVGVEDTTVVVKGGKMVWDLGYDRKKNASVIITISRGGVSSELRFPDELWVQ